MIVHPETKSLLLRARPDTLPQIKGLIPHHKAIDYNGHNLAVRHDLETVKVLRNMGIKAPSPIRYHYNWPRPARFANIFEHQFATADFLTLHPRCFVLNQMGTSKTASALWAADYLMSLKLVKRVLIVAPLSTLEMVWLDEIFSVCMHRTAIVLHADSAKRKSLLAREADIYIINHDGLKIVSKEIAARKDIDLVIVDEAAAYRNAETERYKVLERTIKGKKLWLMTGTPCPNAPTDAWALARLVNPNLVPPYFSQFRRQTMNQISTYKWVPKPDSFVTAYNALQPAVRFKKSDCLDLPPTTFLNRKCDMSPEQASQYATMRNHLVIEAKSGAQITAVNAADKIGKLRQILCGAVKIGDTEVYDVIPHGPRLKVLLDTLDEAKAKSLVIVPFKGIIETLAVELQAHLDKQGNGERCAVINGDVSIGERNRIFQDYRDDPKLMTLLCHPKVMAHGLNLTQADMMVFYAPIYSNEESEQVLERMARPGQVNNMTVVRIVCNELELGIYSMVAAKQHGQESILSLYKKELAL
jgi:SNF2 family DNA or RNA helicase